MSIYDHPPCKNLVLDAGPLLSLSPLRGLAENYFTVPQVLSELKDKRARDHFERLGLTANIHIEVRAPDSSSLTHVIQRAKETGDYAVLSHSDLCVLALTHALHVKAQQEGDGNVSESVVDAASGPLDSDVSEVSEASKTLDEEEEDEESQSVVSESPGSLYDDPSDDDDGEGEWITPSTVALHKSRARNLLPDASGNRKSKTKEIISVGCMTADFAMQNLLLHMGLALVSVEGRKIEKLKTWVLRCHACFKLCKDGSKKFCPSCGNATLIRASVTLSAASDSPNTSTMQVHLKKNFQYRTRGTIYSIPSPKPGSAKTGTGEGLILREDQIAYVRAKKHTDRQRERDEQKMMKGIFYKGREGDVGSWMDPDWMPDAMVSGVGRKEKNMDGTMPIIGYGRRNPNERKRRK